MDSPTYRCNRMKAVRINHRSDLDENDSQDNRPAAAGANFALPPGAVRCTEITCPFSTRTIRSSQIEVPVVV